MSFWQGFFKKASIGPKVGIMKGMFSKGGLQQAVKSNPLPSANLKPIGMPKRIGGHGVGGMPVP